MKQDPQFLLRNLFKWSFVKTRIHKIKTLFGGLEELLYETATMTEDNVFQNCITKCDKKFTGTNKTFCIITANYQWKRHPVEAVTQWKTTVVQQANQNSPQWKMDPKAPCICYLWKLINTHTMPVRHKITSASTVTKTALSYAL